MAHQTETPNPAPAAPPAVSVGRVFEAPPTPAVPRPAAGGRRWLGLGIIVAELAAVLYALKVFRIEENFGFVKLLPLIFVGFVIHSLLPLRFRQPFFVLISMAAIGGVLGFVHGMALIVLALILLGICHLPIGFAYRVGLVVLLGAVLAAVRLQWIVAPLPELSTLVLPILGSMFMFRLIIYLYDLRHERKPASLWQRLSYFFLLPNVCFPLFPVVDYQRFRSTYYDTDAEAIYQKGLNWMVRGLVQLLIYRAVYYHLVPTPAEVVGLGGVVESMVSTYLLYLRISGQFHMIVGILCLFGFNLPETHHAYLLASSFNDYWRRINIYWKDFMMKIFYYPSLMRLKRYGLQPAMVGATLAVFAGTWILHSYQWLWLRGTFPITAPDALFWGILGGLVVVNSLWEASRGRRRTLSRPHWRLSAATIHALKVTAMLVTITVLWSLWSSGSLSQWLDLVGNARGASATGVAALFGVLAVMVALGVAAQYLQHRGWQLSPLGDRPSFGRSVVVSGGTALALILVGLPSVQSNFRPQVATAIASLQETRLNVRDAEALERGYYEGLLDAENFASALWRVSPQRQPGDWLGVREAGAVIWTNDLLEFELIPSFNATIKRIPFHTNRWGMRDREYTQAKPPGTYRIALLGASHTMGAGVAAEETFESVTEERLNRELAAELGTRFEILNFAIAGYTAHQSAIQALNKLPAFQPDAVFYTAHSNERTRAVRRLAIAVQAGHPIHYPELAEIVARSGATAGMSPGEIERRLTSVGNDLLAWSFRTMVSAARDMGAVPVWIYVPVVEADDLASPPRLRRLAEEAGFIVWDLGGAYAGRDPNELRLASWDTHPNARGHLLLSQALYAQLTESLPELMGER